MEFHDLIDVGAYSRVYKTKFEGSMTATKLIDVSNCNDSIVEIDILSRYNHPNLMNLLKIVPLEKDYLVGLVLPLGESTLSDVVIGFSAQEAFNVIKDVVSGLAFLHINNIAHLDMKIDNILICRNEEGEIYARITDFGTSLVIYPGEYIYSANERITYPYRPPEVHCPPSMYKFSQENDIWSTGLVLLSILCKKFPFSIGPSEKSYLSRIYNTSMVSDRIKKVCKNKDLEKILLGMMKNNPAHRPKSYEIAEELDALRTGFVIGVGEYGKLSDEKRRKAVTIYKNYAFNLNSRVETYFSYFDLLYRTRFLFKEKDDFEIQCAACYALSYCISIGDTILPIDNDEEKPLYLKYETYIVTKLDGMLRNPNLPTVSKDLHKDLLEMSKGKYKSNTDEKGDVYVLRKVKYKDAETMFP